ncbi:hypothetical protein, partial [Escherichia coli]|uniref:hypothetical protein n=1 Tax=Escherichia coli TaxID=562 RepID=UPI003F750D96
MRQQQDEPGRFSICSRQAAVVHDAIAAAERASGKKLNQPNRHIVLNRARAQIESQRYADRQRALREDERQQSEFAWSRPRAP